jgi:hypothetical protein
MSATDLVNDLIEKANANRASRSQRIDAIRASREFTPEAQRNQIADVFTGHRQLLGEIQAEVEGRIVGEQRRLEQKVWRNPSPADTSAAAWRVALDRAETVDTPEKASDLLARAERSEDTLLARAVVLHASSRWPQVTRHYASEYPEFANALTELDAFIQETGSRSRWRTALNIALSRRCRGNSEERLRVSCILLARQGNAR